MIRTINSIDLAEERQQLEDDLEVLNEELNDLTDELAEMEVDEDVTVEELRDMEAQVEKKAKEIEEWQDKNQERLDDLTQCLAYLNDDTLISEDSFTEYVQELAEDVDIPSWIVIDWEATASDVMSDYTAVDFDGETWLVR